MLASILLTLPLLARPTLEVVTGTPIELDGTLQPQEWADAETTASPLGEKGTLRFRLKRTGPWLAIGLEADRTYAGESFRLCVANASGTLLSVVYLGVGHPGAPPAQLRRGAPRRLRDLRYPSECPRGCRARVRVTEPGSWSAEYLLRLSTLGVGRADLRSFLVFLAVGVTAPAPKTFLEFPEGVEDALDTQGYATLTSVDGWGPDETWAPSPPEASREFDDHELLFRLNREGEDLVMREKPQFVVISPAVSGRTDAKVDALLARLEAGRARNPTLPAWTYYRGRLLHESNRFAEAREVVESFPRHMRGLAPIIHLGAEHYLDTQEWDKALEFCRLGFGLTGIRETAGLAMEGKQLWAAELEARARDEAGEERNPVVRLVTAKGTVVCELFENDAPLTVRNFVDLFKRRYYDGLRFHEVAGGFFAGVGDPRTRTGELEGEDGPGFRIRNEGSPRPMLRGTLATVPISEEAAHGSHFVVTFVPLFRESRNATVFGRVLEGQDIVDRLEQLDLLERVEIVSRRSHAYDPTDVRTR